MLTWVIISIIILVSFSYLILYLKRADSGMDEKTFRPFSDIRQQEINEELEAGRLSAEEANQLQEDLVEEVKLTNIKATNNSRLTLKTSYFSYQIFAVFIVVSLLGSLALYQYLGFNKEVVFTQQVRHGQVTQNDMTDFLTYRAYKYDRAEDWYWLGKDNMSLQDYQAAKENFQKALVVAPESEDDLMVILVEYAQTLFFANDQQVSEELEEVLARIFAINPNQATALGLQGIIEFDRQDYKQAILIWQKAILAGANLAERESLLAGISQARQRGDISETQIPSLISHKIKLQLAVTGMEKLPADAVFLVYARTTEQPMPVAIKRLLPSQLDEAIELTNLDNLMPGMSLINTSKVDIVVKLARISDQDLTKGKEIAYSKNVPVNSSKILRLSIDI